MNISIQISAMPFRRQIRSELLALDKLSVQPVMAYSLKRLSRQYAGAAIRVRRSSDDAEQDIGFVGKSLDAAALLAFVGSGDGFISAWYNQVANSHLTQNSNPNQAKIVSAGTIELVNGEPSLAFASSANLLAPAPMANLDELDLVLVHRETARTESIVFDFTGSTDTRGAAHIPWTDGVYYFDIGSVSSPVANWRVNTPGAQQFNKLQLIEMNHSKLGDYKSIAVDGTVLASGVATSPTVECNVFSLGEQNFNGNLSEVLVFDRFLSAADRTLLTADVRSRYSI